MEGGEELWPRLLTTGRQGHRAMLTSAQGYLSGEDKETGGQSAWGGGIGCKDLWEKARQNRMLRSMGCRG